MLDVGRHFFPVPFIKRYIDLLALDWHPGAGGKAWVFVDEVVVR